LPANIAATAAAATAADAIEDADELMLSAHH